MVELFKIGKFSIKSLLKFSIKNYPLVKFNYPLVKFSIKKILSIKILYQKLSIIKNYPLKFSIKNYPLKFSIKNYPLKFSIKNYPLKFSIKNYPLKFSIKNYLLKFYQKLSIEQLRSKIAQQPQLQIGCHYITIILTYFF